MAMTFGGLRGRTLLAVFGVSAVALLLAAVLIAMPMRAQLHQGHRAQSHRRDPAGRRAPPGAPDGRLGRRP